MDNAPAPEPSASSEHKPKPVQKIGKVVIDRELCIGAASCMALAPGTFELDSENKAVVKNPKGDADHDILSAAASCPTNAIVVYDEEGNQIYPAQPNPATG